MHFYHKRRILSPEGLGLGDARMRRTTAYSAGTRHSRAGMGPRGDVLFMRKLLLFIVAVLVIGGVVGAFVLSQWKIPAPKAPVEKTIPDEKFPH